MTDLGLNTEVYARTTWH